MGWLRKFLGESEGAARRMFCVGLAVRLLYLTAAHSYRLRLGQQHWEFGWEMGRVAKALATGYGYADPFNGHSGPTAWVPPLYPLLLAGVFKAFGVYTLGSAWVILAINSVFSAATAPAVYEMGWRCFGREREGMRIALWAGWLWALYPAAMQYAVRWVWETTLTTMLFAFALVVALRIRGVGESGGETQTTGRWAAFGLMWGLIALSNSSLLVFLPACGLWMVWDEVRRAGRLGIAVRNAGIAAVCCAAVMAPWTVRNAVALHAFVPLRANLGAEMYQTAQLWRRGFPWGTKISLAETDPVYRRYVQLGEVAYGKEQGARAMAIIRSHRGAFARQVLLHVDYFWSSVPHPIEHGVMVEVVREMDYAFLSVSGWLGVLLAVRRRVPGGWLFLWAFVLTPLVYYVVTVQARFRHPLEPLICLLSVFLFRSADRTRVWSWQRQREVTG